MLTLNQVLPHFNGKKVELANALKISRQAITGWSETGAIPEAQELKLRYEILPHIFGSRPLHLEEG